jgi:hypothetical protein
MKSLYRYSALVFGLIYGLFLVMMALDTFETGISWYNIAGFFVQSLPAIVIILSSVLGYYKPKYGFFIFLILTVAFTLYFRTYRDIQNFLVISFPPLVITMFLFLSSQKHKKK